jgi:hypothetical protein
MADLNSDNDSFFCLMTQKFINTISNQIEDLELMGDWNCR